MAGQGHAQAALPSGKRSVIS